MLYEIDKINGNVAFNEEFHKYWNVKNPEYQYTSITTLIGKYHQKFDEEYWSRKKAMDAILDKDKEKLAMFKAKVKSAKVWHSDFNLSFGVSEELLESKRQEIIAEWRRINKESTDFGSAYHLEQENMWYDKGNTLVKDPELVLPVKGDFDCIKHNFDLTRDKAIIPEFLIYYTCPKKILHLAGQVDLLIKDGNDIYILDYKTNKDGIKKTAFFDTSTKQSQKMFYPINNMLDTTYNHYNLQLSFYAWMIQKTYPHFNIKMLKLIHVTRQGKKTYYEVPYLKDECTRVLKHYRKKLMTQREYENVEFEPVNLEND